MRSMLDARDIGGEGARFTGFTVMAVSGVLGGLFFAGYAFQDPGGLAAVALTAAWALPTLGLSSLALLRPASAAPALTWITDVLAAATITDAALGVVPRDAWGPVMAVAVLGLGVCLAVLGLHRAGRAGGLLVVLALAQLAATLLAGLWAAGPIPGGHGPGAAALLGGSSGVVVVPVLLAGVLFLVADALERRPTSTAQPAP